MNPEYIKALLELHFNNRKCELLINHNILTLLSYVL
jgi:hypothetical protein